MGSEYQLWQKEKNMFDIFGFFQKRRIARTKQEIEEKRKLCGIQATLNELLREEKEITAWHD